MKEAIATWRWIVLAGMIVIAARTACLDAGSTLVNNGR
jgi:hypothetical protein